MAKHFVGIDVGTTATKAVVLTESGIPLRRVRAPHVVGLPLESGRVDPVSWWGSVQEACRALDAADLELAGIGLSVHSPVAVPMDGTGRHITAGYRFETPGLPEIIQSIRGRLSPAEVALLGNRVTPATFMVAAYLLMQEHEPSAARDIHILGSVGTYIGHRLTGNYALDPTQASYFGAFDVAGTWTWQERLAERLGIPAAILPPVRASLSTMGRLTTAAGEALRLEAGVPVVVGAGDTACAAFAAGIDGGKTRLFTLGTTHVITDHGTAPVTGGLHLQRAHLRQGQWLRHGVSNGGLALSVAARTLGYGTGNDAVPRMVNRAMNAGADTISRSPFFVPHVRAERGPFWLEKPRAGFLGMTADTDETAAAWAAVEGVLFVDRLILESFPRDAAKEIILAGDVSGGEAFTQLAADMFGAPMQVSTESHLPAVGAALLAAEGTGCRLSLRQDLEQIVPRAGLAPVIKDRWQGFAEVRSNYLGGVGSLAPAAAAREVPAPSADPETTGAMISASPWNPK
jgi:xylulokinase